MAVVSELSVQQRKAGGTSGSRRMRRAEDVIPAIIYGGGSDPVPIQIVHKDMLKALEDESFYTRLLTLRVGANEERVVLKDLQWHPAKPRVLHADFFRVSKDHKLNIKVPLHYVNEDKCLGIKTDGGMLIRSINEVEVSCLPEHIPAYIEVDIAELRLGEHLHLSNIAWPEGVESVALSHGEEHDLSLVTIAEQRVAEEAEQQPAEEGDAEVTTEGVPEEESSTEESES